MPIGALILASGFGSDNTTFSPMQQLGTVSPIQRLITTFQQAGIERIAISAEADALLALERHVARLGVVCLPAYPQKNRPFERFDCVRAGLAYLEDKCARILVTPADIPLFTTRTVRLLLDSGAPLVSPAVGRHAGHPLLLASQLIAPVLAYTGDEGLRGAIKNCGVPRTYIEVEDDGVLCDVDSDTDFAPLLEQHRRQSLRPVVKLKIAREQPFFGPGAAQLLTMIYETGSVRVACSHMGVSYSKGWKMLDTMEEQLGARVIFRQQGGKNGGNASLTPEGKALLEQFSLFERRCEAAILQIFEELFVPDAQTVAPPKGEQDA